jgi:hypothetical protein
MSPNSVTLTIQVSNSDNKLTQEEWSKMIDQMGGFLKHIDADIHFAGGSSPEKAWQNYCYVVNVVEGVVNTVFNYVSYSAYRYKQDSIAVTGGQTEFVRPKNITPKDVYA